MRALSKLRKAPVSVLQILLSLLPHLTEVHYDGEVFMMLRGETEGAGTGTKLMVLLRRVQEGAGTTPAKWVAAFRDDCPDVVDLTKEHAEQVFETVVDASLPPMLTWTLIRNVFELFGASLPSRSQTVQRFMSLQPDRQWEKFATLDFECQQEVLLRKTESERGDLLKAADLGTAMALVDVVRGRPILRSKPLQKDEQRYEDLYRRLGQRFTSDWASKHILRQLNTIIEQLATISMKESVPKESVPYQRRNLVGLAEAEAAFAYYERPMGPIAITLTRRDTQHAFGTFHIPGEDQCPPSYTRKALCAIRDVPETPAISLMASVALNAMDTIVCGPVDFAVNESGAEQAKPAPIDLSQCSLDDGHFDTLAAQFKRRLNKELLVQWEIDSSGKSRTEVLERVIEEIREPLTLPRGAIVRHAKDSEADEPCGASASSSVTDANLDGPQEVPTEQSGTLVIHANDMDAWETSGFVSVPLPTASSKGCEAIAPAILDAIAGVGSVPDERCRDQPVSATNAQAQPASACNSLAADLLKSPTSNGRLQLLLKDDNGRDLLVTTQPTLNEELHFGEVTWPALLSENDSLTLQAGGTSYVLGSPGTQWYYTGTQSIQDVLTSSSALAAHKLGSQQLLESLKFMVWCPTRHPSWSPWSCSHGIFDERWRSQEDCVERYMAQLIEEAAYRDVIPVHLVQWESAGDHAKPVLQSELASHLKQIVNAMIVTDDSIKSIQRFEEPFSARCVVSDVKIFLRPYLYHWDLVVRAADPSETLLAVVPIPGLSWALNRDEHAKKVLQAAQLVGRERGRTATLQEWRDAAALIIREIPKNKSGWSAITGLFRRGRRTSEASDLSSERASLKSNASSKPSCPDPQEEATPPSTPDTPEQPCASHSLAPHRPAFFRSKSGYNFKIAKKSATRRKSAADILSGPAIDPRRYVELPVAPPKLSTFKSITSSDVDKKLLEKVTKSSVNSLWRAPQRVNFTRYRDTCVRCHPSSARAASARMSEAGR